MNHGRLPPVAPSGLAVCERCGQALAAPDAVCQPCDEALAAESDDRVPPGPHECPACKRSFARPSYLLLPAKAKWYVPQRQGLGCPHCQVLLVDRRHPRMPAREGMALIVLALGFWCLLPASQFRIGLSVLVLIFLGLQLRRSAWRVPAHDRYALDPAPKPVD